MSTVRSLNQSTTREDVTVFEDVVEEQREVESFPSMDDAIKVIRAPTFLLKVLELVLNSIALIEFMADYTPIMAHKSKWAVILGTLVGYIMISIMTIVAALLKSPLPRSLFLTITLSAVLMFFATGGLIFEQYHQAKHSTAHLLISGMVALISGITYACHFVLTLYNYGNTWRCGS
jgi:hypothetical protein